MVEKDSLFLTRSGEQAGSLSLMLCSLPVDWLGRGVEQQGKASTPFPSPWSGQLWGALRLCPSENFFTSSSWPINFQIIMCAAGQCTWNLKLVEPGTCGGKSIPWPHFPFPLAFKWFPHHAGGLQEWQTETSCAGNWVWGEYPRA